MIQVSGLSYEYPGLRALDNVSFAIAPGTITALVGPNGAGKTTLLRCLAGMDRPLTGAIVINGIDVVEEPRVSHRHVGYLADFFGLYADLTVRQCLSYVAAANGLAAPVVAQTVADTATVLGLDLRLEQRAGQLSRGLRQRVAIAQAIIHAPTVVLLDEPASGLDPEARYALGELFLTLKRRGLTLIVSSHILAELEAYSTHMLILRSGRMVEHRALAAPAAQATRIEVVALEGPAALAAALRDQVAIAAIAIHGNAVHCDVNGDEAVRANVVKGLIESGLRIVQFAPVVEDLQQSYIDSLARAGAASES